MHNDIFVSFLQADRIGGAVPAAPAISPSLYSLFVVLTIPFPRRA